MVASMKGSSKEAARKDKGASDRPTAPSEKELGLRFPTEVALHGEDS